MVIPTGFEPMTAKDCYEDEIYDEQDKTCYLVEEDEEDYIDEVSNREMTPYDEDELPEGNLYQIENGKIEIIAGETEQTDQVIWDYFVELFPANIHKNIVQYLVYQGDDDTMAFVTQLEEGKNIDIKITSHNMAAVRHFIC